MSFDPIMALTELQERNRLRKSASLPVLDIESELRRLEQVHKQSVFSAYLDLHRSLYHRALRRAIFRRGQAYGNLNWQPKSWEGMDLEMDVREVFWRRFLGDRSVAGST